MLKSKLKYTFLLLNIFLIVTSKSSFSQENNFKPVKEFPLDSILYNGVSVKSKKDIFNAKFKICLKPEECINDSSLTTWLTYDEFEKVKGNSKVYFEGQEIIVPENLYNTPLFRSVDIDVEKIWLNGKLIYDFTINDNKKIYDINFGTLFPFSFNKKKNYLIHQINIKLKEGKTKLFFSPAFKSYFSFLNWIKKNQNSNLTLGTLSSFLFAVTLMLFFIYLFGIRDVKYLWGGAFIFILAATTFLFTDFITGFDSGGMGMILLFVSPYFLVQFIYSLFNFQLPKWAKLSLIVLSIFLVCFVIMIILEIKFLENLLNNDEGGISILIPTILLFSLSSTFVFIGIFKAIKQKQNNAWTLFIGLIAIIALTIFAVIENFFTDSFVSGTNWYKVLHILPMPLSVLIAIVRDYVASNKNLKFQLSKVEELTAQTLKEQQEKQEILSKQNEVLEVQVTERTKEINEQKNLLQEKQKEILDSIGYAKRLQSAILPPESFIQQHVEDYFILYKPKDIVAGDFYWAEQIDHLFFIAAADSTGHGVPGAMVSVVCSSALNRSVKEFYLKETGKILDKARELVIETFEKSNADIKDGMDISLLCIDSKNNKIFWSGANNPLWYIQENQLKEITADKQPIGKVENIKPFTTHEINYRKGSIFYLFTDGYADQFGGPKGKKFKYKQLQELLLNTQNLAMENQLTAIENRFNEWTGSLEQVDDVCILGLKI